MAKVTVCENCGTNLMGSYVGRDYHRPLYISVITHNCESPHVSNEKETPDKHFCHGGCLKNYYSKLAFSVGDGGNTTVKTTMNGGTNH